jgi:hypothetical protein
MCTFLWMERKSEKNQKFATAEGEWIRTERRTRRLPSGLGHVVFACARVGRSGLPHSDSILTILAHREGILLLLEEKVVSSW